MDSLKSSKKNDGHAIIQYLQKKDLTPHRFRTIWLVFLGMIQVSSEKLVTTHDKERCECVESTVRSLTLCSNENINRIYDLIKQDRWLATSRLAEMIDLSNGTVETIINDQLVAS